MSLEAQIELLNTNVEKLIGALAALGQTAPAEEIQHAPDAPAPQPESAPAKAADYDTVKNAVLRLAATNRAKAVEILGKYGAKRVQDLKPADYDAVLFIVQAELGE